MGCGQQMRTATIEGDDGWWEGGDGRWLFGWKLFFVCWKPSAKKGNINSRHSMSNIFTYIWLISMVHVGR